MINSNNFAGGILQLKEIFFVSIHVFGLPSLLISYVNCFIFLCCKTVLRHKQYSSLWQTVWWLRFNDAGTIAFVVQIAYRLHANKNSKILEEKINSMRRSCDVILFL